MSSEQEMEKIKAGGNVRQVSAGVVIQRMKEVEAQGDVIQRILSQPENLERLAQQLNDLKIEAASAATNADEKFAVGAIDAAATAAKEGNAQGMRDFLSHLAPVGKWAFDLATKVGASLLAEVLKAHLGMG